MATGTVVFQSTTLASPPVALAVMADAVNDTDHGAGTAQYIKIMDGATAGTLKAGVSANGLAVDVTRVQGTVQALGSIQTVGTSQVLGSVQLVGTNQALGTIQPLAGSVHVANTAAVLGSVSAQGYIAHGVLAAGNPMLAGAFGSSGTQAFQGDGSIVRLWADPNGRLQVRGTIDSIGTIQVLGSVQTVGTSQVLGTTQPLAGSVHVANTLPGTVQVLGSVQTVGTNQVLGSVQTVGTSQVLGTVRTLIGGTGLGESFFGTLFTAGVTNGTLVPAPASGTFIRVFDILVSGSAAGTAFLEFGDGTAFGPIIAGANGGYVFNSARGVRTKASALDILFNAASGTWGVTVNYILET